MARISTYPLDTGIVATDKLLGSDENDLSTKNFQVSDLTTYISSQLPGSVAAYKTYTALLNQTGTAAPVATILENTTDGTFTWTRQSAGTYTITASSALFTVNKTIVFGNQGNQTNQYWRWNRTSDTTIDLVTNPSFAGDIGIINGSFEIRIYN
jgi:hypothetical protein